MNARRMIVLLILVLLGSFAACSQAPQEVVDIGNPPDTSTITPQKATLAGLEMECSLGYTLTASETEASCVVNDDNDDDDHSWFAKAYDDESGLEDKEAVAQQAILDVYPRIDPALIVFGDLGSEGEKWATARAELRFEIFTVYVSTVDATIVELRIRRTGETDRPEVTVTPRPRPR